MGIISVKMSQNSAFSEKKEGDGVNMVSVATSKPASVGHFRTSHSKGGLVIGWI
jgi:hypothetical protein